MHFPAEILRDTFENSARKGLPVEFPRHLQLSPIRRSGRAGFFLLPSSSKWNSDGFDLCPKIIEFSPKNSADEDEPPPPVKPPARPRKYVSVKEKYQLENNRTGATVRISPVLPRPDCLHGNLHTFIVESSGFRAGNLIVSDYERGAALRCGGWPISDINFPTLPRPPLLIFIYQIMPSIKSPDIFLPSLFTRSFRTWFHLRSSPSSD